MRHAAANGDGELTPAEVIVLDRSAPDRPGVEDFSRGSRGLSTARAVLRVLAFMARHPEGVSAREVAEELGKSISTAYDLLASLYEEGFAFHEPGRGYRLSAGAMSDSRPEPSHDKALARAVEALFARTRRRSYVARVETGAIVITNVCGRQGIPRVPRLEPRINRSAHAFALGKVVLSLLPEDARRRYIERGLQAYTPRTITSPEPLMAELDEVRSTGFAVDCGEFDSEYCSIAAPVFDRHGRFLAVLGLSTYSRSFETDAESLVDAVREVAAAVVRRDAIGATPIRPSQAA